MKQSRKSDRLRGRRIFSGTIALLTISTSLIPYSQRAEANPGLAAPITACMTNPYCAIAVVTVGGLAYWQLNQNGQTKWIPLAPIIDNPDEQTEDFEYDPVWANSYAEAYGKCEALASAWGIKLLGVRQIKGKKYACQFRG